MNIQIVSKAVVKTLEVSQCIAFVESETEEGHWYKVTFDEGWTCTCPNHKFRETECKHIVAVNEHLHNESN